MMKPTVPSVGPLGEVTCVSGQTFCLSESSGQIRPGGGQGVYIRDTRVLSGLVLRVNDEEPQGLGGHPLGPGSARFVACTVVNDNNDPAVLIERRRIVTDAWAEQVRFTNHGAKPVQLDIEVEVEADFAYVFEVKNGRTMPSTSGLPVPSGLRFEDPLADEAADLHAEPAPHEVTPGSLRWSIALATQTTADIHLRLTHTSQHEMVERAIEPSAGTSLAGAGMQFSLLRVECSDERFSELVHQGISDLESLLVHDGPERYFAAGTPWFLTLFGRDSLWSAQMSLPLGTSVAGETLRVLARHQGQRHDADTEEAPGKILHEIRHGSRVDRGDLPPLYYGSVDATPLFVTTLERAWRWGLDPAVVEGLLPSAERALVWMAADGDSDGDGFLEYAATGERKLANQGWKDSSDAIFFADGRLAEPPVALCEVQGYAYQAALAGAALLDAFGRPGAQRWRSWAAALRQRFAEAFWVGTGRDRFPAIALDGHKQPVDTLASNIGHLPATGILDAAGCAQVAAHLATPELDCGWGLRTATSASPRFNPLSYHGGSVWPHDTAIAVDGLAQAGEATAATSLLRGLVAAGQHFDYRLPELFGGEQRTRGTQPLPYPSACRPQAWAAGSALLLLRAVIGLEPDIPAGVVRLRPLRPAPFPSLTVEGLALAGGRLSISIDGEGVRVIEAPEGLDVRVG